MSFFPCWHNKKCPSVIHHVWIYSEILHDPYLADTKMTTEMKSVTYMLQNAWCSLRSQYYWVADVLEIHITFVNRSFGNVACVAQPWWISATWTSLSFPSVFRTGILKASYILLMRIQSSFKIRTRTNLSSLFIFFNLLSSSYLSQRSEGGWCEQGHSVKLPLLSFILIIFTLTSRR